MNIEYELRDTYDKLGFVILLVMIVATSHSIYTGLIVSSIFGIIGVPLWFFITFIKSASITTDL